MIKHTVKTTLLYADWRRVMRNILSYQQGTKFTGKEILDWANFQVENETSNKKQGLSILNRFSNINPDRLYQINTTYKGTGCGEIINKPIIIRCSLDCENSK